MKKSSGELGEKNQTNAGCVSQYTSPLQRNVSLFSQAIYSQASGGYFSSYPSCRTPLQVGNFEQPQNSPPALPPLRAVRLTMLEPHCGQGGCTATGSVTWTGAAVTVCLFACLLAIA
jgi:hypothetical protein